MPLIVPVFPGEPLYQERVKLEGRDYIFRFDWSNREERYFMSIKDHDETNRLIGLKVIAKWGFLILTKFNAALPPGDLIAIDLESGGEPPTFNDFGTRVKLYYFESTEDLSEFAP